MIYNIKKIIVVILILVFIFVGCNKAEIEVIDKNLLESNKDEGISVFNKEKNYKTKYIPENKIHLNEIVEDGITDKVAVITKNGSVNIISSNIYLDNDGDSVFSIDNNKNKIEYIKGIYLWDNYYSITDVYYDMKNYLDNNKKVMAVLLDGFSYNQYKVASEMGYVPFLSQYFQHEALSVYTPVTNAGYAAIITGQTPDINGVHDRSFRQMDVDSIFEFALNNDKKQILLEGDIKILNTEIEPNLHIDINKDGDTDDEMFDSGIKAAAEDYDLIFIHFHGIDDRGHSYGPESDETMDYIKKIDGYLENLSEVWGGSMILTADHGMHETEDAGSHGECRAEDMVVPYFLKEQ